MPQILEALMVICFGASWPLSLVKSYTSRSTKGKSLFFLLLIEAGYLCGIGAKFAAGQVNYVLAFYILNLLMVAADIVLYGVNRRRETAAGKDAGGEG